MMVLNDIKRIYFAGIGGIGMSAIARFFLSKGVVVSGYDKTSTALTRQLEVEGATIHYTDDVALLDKDVQLVVFTPAIPADHAGLSWYKAQQYPIVKRSDVLQIITESSFNICIAGTHGKTSISTMVGHLLRHSGYGCNVFLGGISVNYQTNFWSSTNNVTVVEADEYDRSFLKLSPDIAVVTAMDADHLDIYGTVEAMREAFVAFAGRLRPGGLLIRKHHLLQLDEAAPGRLLSYRLSDDDKHHAVVDTEFDEHDHHHHGHDAPADVYAANIRVQQGGYLFDAHIAGAVLRDVQLHVGGLHNIENMLVAICIAKALRISDELIKAGVASYQGVRRRFEYVLAPGAQANGRILIDDYAHHPEELRALITSARQLFPGKQMQVLFQPHLYSRTRDLATAFAEVLSLADEVVLLPIYPARELPIAGVSSHLIALQMPAGKCQVMEREAWLLHLAQRPPALLITAGAGDIDLLLPQAKQLMMTS
jgi:UDP-N-acetylmuramate--alanine ligase